MSDLSANICAQCGQRQTDDEDAHGINAPMIHTGRAGVPFHAMTAGDIISYHLDCMPHDLEAQHRDQHGVSIDAAKAGKRGHELHAIIQDAAAAHRAGEQAWLVDEQAKYAASPEGKADTAWREGIDLSDPVHAKVKI